ncbi:MAG: hypothetical protein M3P12_13305 [Gemmatimonadota bacterium]|nr:hypothetical protein [Gemmatimonadota bacterium]
MPQKPERPFVPHRTPTTARPPIGVSEFRLYTPFVPGDVRQTLEVTVPPALTRVAEAQSDANVLRPIEDFLDSSPLHPATYQQGAEDLPDVGDFEEEPDELPPVEHFIDPLPAVEQFAPTSAEGADPAESGWVETDWQHYDWLAAAALGESGNAEASNAWATTDWDATAPRARELRQTAAHAIATALDEIAQRIRSGELAVPGRGAMTDPANIAATLATLLGVKR